MMADNNLNISTVLLGTTIHDLKTHLTAIIAAADLLAEETQSDSNDTKARLLKAIIRNARNMDGKLSKLLKSDFYFDGVQAIEKDIRISQIVRLTMSELKPIFNSKNQGINIDVPSDLSPLKIHRQYVEYIVKTLVHNASKFTPSDGNIQLTARQNDGFVTLEVKDSGIGIPDEELDRIFELHSQVVDNETGENNGSGIGLTMAKYLAELNGGKMWVTSTVGRGSSFFISLPAYQEREK